MAIARRALTADGGEHLTVDGLPDPRRRRHAVLDERDHRGEVRAAIDERLGAIDWIHKPSSVVTVGDRQQRGVGRYGFFADDRDAWLDGVQCSGEQVFTFVISIGDPVAWGLLGDCVGFQGAKAWDDRVVCSVADGTAHRIDDFGGFCHDLQRLLYRVVMRNLIRVRLWTFG